MSPQRSTVPEMDLHALTMGATLRLEDLVERSSLQEVMRSFSTLFGLSARVFSSDGQLLADCAEQQMLCQYLNQLPDGRAACNTTISAVKRSSPEVNTQIVHPCFTGAHYKIASLCYDGRNIGRVVLGPYLPVDVREAPGSLSAAVPSIDPIRAKELLPRLPRAREETVTLIADHLRRVLDLILFSGHKALLTSQMHLASVRESYRELQDKNAKLQDAYDKLKELDRLKSNFIATVSHELRTPLTSIIGYSEMLAEGIAGEINGEQTEFVLTIREKGEQLLALIMNLLDLSKLESGTRSLQKSDTDITQLLNDVVTSIKPSARKKKIDMAVQADSSLPLVRADPNSLRQAVLNLAENAIKFTSDGGHVQLSAALVHDSSSDADDSIAFALLSPVRNFLEIRVADSGIGIPEAEREKVFDAFYQVDSSSTREYGGTGLGLAIVKRLIEAHDGKARIESNQPNGTVVIITLPLGAATG
jgi:two-component system, NarL family, sensor histidine kinase BarA